MPVWIILAVLLLLLLILPVGGELRYGAEGLSVKLRIGPLSFSVFPSAGKKTGKAQKTENDAPGEPKRKASGGLKKDDIFALLRIGLKTLNRLRLHLSIDLLELDWVAGGSDPYDTVLQYGRVNAAIGALQGPVHGVLRIREERVHTDLDLNAPGTVITAHLIATIQIWEILTVAVCAGVSLLIWYRKRKTRSGAAEAPCTEGKGKKTWKTTESEAS